MEQFDYEPPAPQSVRRFKIYGEDMTNERKNITQPPDWWAAFEKAAQARGQSLSAWIGAACLQCLTIEKRKKLSERKPANRPKGS